jgi:hypothetical protein
MERYISGQPCGRQRVDKKYDAQPRNPHNSRLAQKQKHFQSLLLANNKLIDHHALHSNSRDYHVLPHHGRRAGTS